MIKLVKLNLFISVSAASLKSVEGCDMVRNIPLENLLVESDGPNVMQIREHVRV
jgi:Tat protein secretion system quality control protein TatD with DNase activity